MSELVGSKTPNTTLSAMLMMYLFLAKALCLELRGRWEREILAYKEFIFVTMQNTNNPLKIKGNTSFFVDLPENIWYFENFCVILHEISDIRYLESKFLKRSLYDSIKYTSSTE